MIIVGTPRHADVLFIAGYQTHKSLERAKRVYEQMAEPKVVIALGSCTMTGGMYWDSYNTIINLRAIYKMKASLYDLLVNTYDIIYQSQRIPV